MTLRLVLVFRALNERHALFLATLSPFSPLEVEGFTLRLRLVGTEECGVSFAIDGLELPLELDLFCRLLRALLAFVASSFPLPTTAVYLQGHAIPRKELL